MQGDDQVNNESTVTMDKAAVPGRIKWFKALRAYSFPASMAPVLVGIAAASFAGVAIDWWTIPFVALVGLLIHIGTNLINDAVDYEKGVDAEGALGGSGVIVDGWLSSNQMRWAAIGAFLAAGVVGIPVLAVRGWELFAIGAIGVIGGYFYTAPPVSLKYRALGDLAVFFLVGPVMVIGVAYAVSGQVPMAAIYAGIPIGMIITAVLVANNLRDLEGDSDLKIKTLAMFLGPKGTKYEYLFLVFGAFASVPIMAFFGLLSWWTCLSLIALIPAMGPVKDLMAERLEKQVVERTAQFHLAFAVLLSIGLFI
jgi:1,4-dihydroxy-2-naphthoate polyprenyltransferase